MYSKDKTDTKNTMAKKKNKNYFGVIFWLASILIVLIVYLWNKPTITQVIEKTGFMEVVKEKFSPRPQKTQKPENSSAPKKTPTPQKTQAPAPTPSPKPTQTIQNTAKPSPSPKPAQTPGPAETQKPQNEGKEINLLLYFAKVYDNGEVITAPIPRKIHYKDAPLTRTLQELLKGPTETEKQSGIKSLIPQETKLLGVSVKSRVAYINLSEEFRFNPLGQEGLLIELKQIVYTATQFPTVDRVQILIEGKIIPYLAPEGIPIGRPLKPDEI